jgi:hypothetical protein
MVAGTADAGLAWNEAAVACSQPEQQAARTTGCQAEGAASSRNTNQSTSINGIPAPTMR